VQTQSLKELKAENGGEVEPTIDEPVEQPKEELQDEYVEVDENLKPVEDEPEAEEEEATEELEIESWMQTDEATSEESGFVPNHEAAKRRKQTKALKATVSEQESEIEQLKRQVEQLSTGQVAPQQPQAETLPARPTREQFDYDDDAYDKAVDEWNDKKLELKFNNFNQSNQQKQQEQAQQKQLEEAQAKVNKAVDSHYERAGELVTSGKVKAEQYQQADQNVRLAMDKVFQGKGDLLTDQLISKLGEGSEKILFSLGVNNTKLAELQSKMINDPSGIEAAVYLGELKTELKAPTKRRSQARKPAKHPDGDVQTSDSASKLHKKYEKMTSIQERISFKRQAKRDGIDVSNW
jgi:hypothetical protein